MVWPLISPILSHFVSFTFFVTILTWISMTIGAAITFLVRTDHGMPRTFKGFLRFCFPPEIVRVKTCRVDAFFYVVNRISSPLIVTPLLLGSAFCATLTYQGLTRLTDRMRRSLNPPWYGWAPAASSLDYRTMRARTTGRCDTSI